MKHPIIKKYLGIFVIAVLIIAVYKTFDSMGILFNYIKDFLALLGPVFAAFAIAFILHPLCKKFESLFRKTKVAFFCNHCRGCAITSVYLAALACVAGFFAILLPMVFESITQLIQQLPGIIENVGKFLYSLDFAGYNLKPFLDRITISDVMTSFNLSDVQTVVQSIAGFSKGIINVFLAIIISIYILADRAGLLSTIDKVSSILIPDNKRDVVKKYVNRTFFIMYRYVYCQLLDAVIVFALSFIALTIMGIEYAPILAIFIGIFNIIPYFGATIACTVTALLTLFSTSLYNAVVVAIVLIVLQQIDANLIQPKLVKDSLKVKPFWVLFGILVGGGLFGMLGILLAVPFMALIKTIFEDYYDYHMNLEKNDETPSSEEELEFQ